MYKFSPKILTLVLLLILVAPVFLFTGFFIKQKHIQHKMHERLERTALHTITANVTDVKWVKKNKEVEIYGRLFDVKHYLINGNKITLTGLYDEEEHELKKDLAKLMKEEKDGSSPNNQLVVKFNLFIAFIPNNIFDAQQFTALNKISSALYSEQLRHQYIVVATPPPNCI